MMRHIYIYIWSSELGSMEGRNMVNGVPIIVLGVYVGLGWWKMTRQWAFEEGPKL